MHGNFTILIRAADQADAIAAYRRSASEIVPTIPVLRSATLQQQIDDAFGRERLITMTTNVFGVVALLLERNPNLAPEDIRKILTVSAKHPGAKERDDDLGSGLVDPSKAIQDAGEVRSIGQPTAKR